MEIKMDSSNRPSPVRIRTIKEIVDGTYGRVRVMSLGGVSDKKIGVRFVSTEDSAHLCALTAKELTEAIETLSIIRDVLASR